MRSEPMRSRMHNLLPKQDGSAMVEMSLILPILVLLLLAVLDCGLLLEQAMMVADSARAGAAYAIPWANAGNTAGMVAVATQSAAAIPGYSASAANVCLCSPGGAATSCASRCSNGNVPAQYAQVTATASIPLLFAVQGFPARIPVSSTARMRTARRAPQ